ncbi:DUF805 domain-containing protein [Sphingomonas bacterium]|uniref:DUF805 domain-containing protein n=1 Tax=Sphingomonas bacterium TaxID=1895847 RepID=UPI00260C5A9B|nr:DUF805 domain-containing protein [Sphingomonas bacterium]MDB5679233.1 hypothetical protein [Sphingomonas bacterium]
MEWMFMPLKRYAEFSGRSRRMEFWMYQLGVWLLWMALWVVMMVIGFGTASAARDPAAGMVGMFASLGIFMVVFAIVALGLFIPSLAVAVRRLHDTDRSGWWLLAPIAPYILTILIAVMAASSQSSALAGIAMIVNLGTLVAGIVLLVFYCLPGTPGPNKYGPDPLGGTANLQETFQ